MSFPSLTTGPQSSCIVILDHPLSIPPPEGRDIGREASHVPSRPFMQGYGTKIMARKFFGTDGIRGRANDGILTAELAMKVGQAAGRHFLRGDHRHRVVIGKDTRLSGYMMENALVAGFTSVGMDVIMTGPLPTPAVALLTREMRADLGVMISASHNPFDDNGIKLFGPDGFKLSDEDELAIEGALTQPCPLANGGQIGRARRIDDARGRYIHAVKASLPDDVRLDGLKIVVDCANGAAYTVAPSAIWELGAEVVAIGVEPNGLNINDGVGSTSLDAVKAKVIEERADIGIALDGDADRLIVVDEKGNAVDGDQIMALIGSRLAAAGDLRGGGVVATVMSNLGLERFLAGQGIDLLRTKVGDRYVLETMRKQGCNVGGEQSGHMILLDHATTGDGTVAALQVLGALVRSGKRASELLHMFDPVPQLLRNVRYAGGAPLENAQVRQVIADAEGELKGKGRLVIRPSGTEPVIRVMAEGDDQTQVEAVVDRICQAVAEAA
jgi:phosphoglucosamine mutase